MQCQSGGNMEEIATGNVSPAVFKIHESQGVRSSESAENFQKFMYDLFEKNGVLNDLRAYLRGHILKVLRSAQTGDPLSSQKHFSQRLELPYQALNILIAEYLLRMEFNYALSVFISEIPLANMVFEFAKSLMKSSSCDSGLHFRDKDIWSILSYLGVKCDSDHASNIVKTYKADNKSPLLLCILKCMPLYKETFQVRQESSQDSLSSSILSSDALDDKRPHCNSSRDKCKHYRFCRTCQNKMTRIKEKYTNKKKTLAKNILESNIYAQNMESLVKNIDVVERSLIDEMFQQLKSVYEAEIEQMKSDEEKRVKRTLLTHATHLQKKRAEMEETLKAREAELERDVEQKKRFLWGLARALRHQHSRMSRAMQDVRLETTRLSAKEDSLKCQLLEAEQILRQRGEEMRHQISSELVILEGHLESMKRERDNINKERCELENIKHLCDNSTKNGNTETNNDDLRTHYDLLKNELVILKKYLQTAKLEPKCVIERSTMTDLADVTNKIDVVLNNGQDIERAKGEDRLKPNQVLNDLKKMKNVNFSQSNMEQIYRSRSRSSASSDAGDMTAPFRERSSLQRLTEENERLRIFATQQSDHIDELRSQQARVQAELTAARMSQRVAPMSHRPRTAPATMPDFNVYMQRLASSASGNHLSLGWRKGAGEELSFFANAQPRIVVPGDTLPFIGVIKERQTDSRRYLINQWRSLRRRVSPVTVAQPRHVDTLVTNTSRDNTNRDNTNRDNTNRDNTSRDNTNTAGPSVSTLSETDHNHGNGKSIDDHYEVVCQQSEQRPKTPETKAKRREKSPKSLLKHAKDNLKTREYNTRHPSRDRTKSPNSVLRDAKLRLRKLEIEAEAVEQSYMDFRRKREVMKDDTRNTASGVGQIAVKEMKSNTTASILNSTRVKESAFQNNEPQNSATFNFGQYVDDYRGKSDASKIHLKNQNVTPSSVTPSKAFTMYETAQKIQNYLETPMTEFRKYYSSESRVVKENRVENSLMNTNDTNTKSTISKNQGCSEGVNVPTSVAGISSLQSRNVTHTLLTENVDKNIDYKSETPECSATVDINIPLAKTYENDENGNGGRSLILNIEKAEGEKSHAVIQNEKNEKSGHLDGPKTDINPELIHIRDRSRSPLNQNRRSAKNIKFSQPASDVSILPKSPTIIEQSDYVQKAEVIKQTKHDVELEILTRNIDKINNFYDDSVNEDSNENFNEAKDTVTPKESVKSFELAADIYRSEITVSEANDLKEDKNLLRIELENVSEMREVQMSDPQTQELSIAVESSINVDKSNTIQSSLDFEKDKFSSNMTILVSPIRTNEGDEIDSSKKKRIVESTEKTLFMRESRDDFVANQKTFIDNISSPQMQLQVSKDVPGHALRQSEASEDPDYPDDFSGDVDNFELEHDTHSPISLPKMSDDENFWDS